MSEIHSSKEKPAHGYSYFLKSSLIQSLLSENDIQIPTYINFINTDRFFDAEYLLPNQNVEYHRFYITDCETHCRAKNHCDLPEEK